MTDSVTVTGLGGNYPAPSGTVIFQASTDNGATWVNFGSTKTLTEGTAVSDSYTPAAEGTVYFRAVYLGDNNYLGSQSGDKDEPLTTNPSTPTIITTVSSSTLTLGQSVYDTATVTGLPDFVAPSGSVTFWVSTDSINWIQVGGSVNLNGGVAVSANFVPSSAGLYYFQAVFSGDCNYVTVTSGATDEPFTVNQASPSISTVLSTSTITLGGSVTDSVTVSGLGNGFPCATGTVLFEVSTDNGATWNPLGQTKILTNGYAVSDSYTPASTGTFYFRATYSGDGNYLGSQSDNAAEPLAINQASPSILTTLSTSTLTLGQSLHDTATVTGSSGFVAPSGSVTFWVSTDGTSWSQLGSAVDLIGGSATSADFTPTSAGSYYFQAIYSGDSNYISVSSDSTSEPFSVTKAQPCVSTQLSVSTLTLGSSLTDSVTVTGLGIGYPTPQGTVQFQVSTNNGASWSTFGATKTLSGGTAVSDSYKPTATGTYYFRAIYTGDSNYQSSQSGNTAEPLAVQAAPSSTTTVLSCSTITLGGSVTDKALVSGGATGQVTFQVSTNAVNFVQYGATKTLSGGSATSDSYKPAAAGTYYFRAVYLGDTTHPGSQSSNTAEPLTVNLATPTIKTTLSACTLTLGQSIYDTATVSGLSGFVAPSGSVTFWVSTDTHSWSQVGGSVALSSGSAVSASFTPTMAGSYYFQARYSGDSNYAPASSGATCEPFCVNKASTCVSTSLSSSSITLGASVTDSVTVKGTGANSATPTGTVQFQVSSNNGASWSNFGSSKPLSSGTAVSDSYTPGTSGTYYFRAVYSGDSNYVGSQSGNCQEPLTVIQKKSSCTTTCLSSCKINVGCSVTDTAYVTSGATGNVIFQVSTDGVNFVQYGSIKTLSGGKAVSDSYTPPSAGTYYFRALYQGDSNYLASQSGNCNEQLTVNKKCSCTTTCLSSDSITLGNSVTDTAYVTSGATGQVMFEVSTDGCTFLQYGALKTISGGSAVSDVYTPSAAGTYYFKAVYLGDNNYCGSQSCSCSEQLTVQNNYSGLTPGFWKNHTCLWQGNKPTDSFNTVFGVSIQIGCDSNPSLLTALQSGGGGVTALARQAVAALLNSEHQYINYPLTKTQIITLVHNAIKSGNSATITALTNQLETYNSLGGGIDAHGNPI